MRTMFAITHIDKDGMRTLTFANQGRNHYDTREEAEKALATLIGDLRAKVLHDMADTLKVREVKCYDHGDAIGIYFKPVVGDRVCVDILLPNHYAKGCADALNGVTGTVEKFNEDGEALVRFDKPARTWWTYQSPPTGFWFPPQDLKEIK